MNFPFPPQIFGKYSIIIFYENTSIEAEFFHADRRTYGQTERERERELSKLIVAFRNVANAPRNYDFWEIRRR